MRKRIILIDLDGVLNNYKRGMFKENYIPEIKAGAKEFLEKLHKKAKLYLFTSRDLSLAKKWLVENNLDIYFEDVTNTKIPAYLYIDDRCICFNGNFDDLTKQIQEYKAHWDK